MYVFGGDNGSGFVNDMHILNLEAMTWEQAYTAGSSPSGRSRHTCALIGSCIFVFGGGDDDRVFNDLSLFDITTQTWSKPSSLSGPPPPARWGHAMAVIDKDIVVFGGHDGTSMLNDLYALDTTKFVWRLIHNTASRYSGPSPRAGHTLTSLSPRRSSAVLFGGGDGNNIFSDLYLLERNHNGSYTWKVHIPLPAPPAPPSDVALPAPIEAVYPAARCAHTATLSPNRDQILIFGGGDSARRFRDFFILNIPVLISEIEQARTMGLVSVPVSTNPSSINSPISQSVPPAPPPPSAPIRSQSPSVSSSIARASAVANTHLRRGLAPTAGPLSAPSASSSDSPVQKGKKKSKSAQKVLETTQPQTPVIPQSIQPIQPTQQLTSQIEDGNPLIGKKIVLPSPINVQGLNFSSIVGKHNSALSSTIIPRSSVLSLEPSLPLSPPIDFLSWLKRSQLENCSYVVSKLNLTSLESLSVLNEEMLEKAGVSTLGERLGILSAAKDAIQQASSTSVFEVPFNPTRSSRRSSTSSASSDKKNPLPSPRSVPSILGAALTKHIDELVSPHSNEPIIDCPANSQLPNFPQNKSLPNDVQLLQQSVSALTLTVSKLSLALQQISNSLISTIDSTTSLQDQLSESVKKIESAAKTFSRNTKKSENLSRENQAREDFFSQEEDEESESDGSDDERQ
eukprot:TRINITY_DN5727_c0_g2_i3.p1 TRINITY_DN5727_c0_g2~~TRINITY_DN5727_c0_g2_i3.p1  ORF type:complete len:682 (-),score=154.90 TRINITY_DN5727_c0_g2_i3:181-2226(-)